MQAIDSIKEELASEGMLPVDAEGDEETAASFTGLSRTTLYRLMESGLPYSQMGPGSKRLIPKRALKVLMAKRMRVGDAFLHDYIEYRNQQGRDVG